MLFKVFKGYLGATKGLFKLFNLLMGPYLVYLSYLKAIEWLLKLFKCYLKTT
jgi:hypothetical protein